MNVLLKTTVGSKLHRLDTPESDEDTKGIYVSALSDLTDPFTDSTKVLDASAKDETLYELRHFCRLAVKGNPTVLEMLWSDLVLQENLWGQIFRYNRTRFLDGHAIKSAHLGYAKSQIQKLTREAYDGPRAAKATVAWIRVLQQGIDLLEEGTFWPNLADRHKELHDFLRELKFGNIAPETGRVMAESLDMVLQKTPVPDTMVPDYDWIRGTCHNVYIT